MKKLASLVIIILSIFNNVKGQGFEGIVEYDVRYTVHNENINIINLEQD